MANNAPLATQDVLLNISNESEGKIISSLFQDSFSDDDSEDRLLGIVIVKNQANINSEGSWQFSSNGGASWRSIATKDINDASGLYVSADSKVRFVPVSGFTGTPGSVDIRLVDNSYKPLSVPNFEKTGFSLKIGSGYSFPEAVDIDHDGDIDLYIGHGSSGIYFVENSGESELSESLDTFPRSNFGVELTGGGTLVPTLVDIDGDGDDDLFIGEYSGDITFYENTGNIFFPSFGEQQRNPFGISNEGGRANPDFVDIDGDKDWDLMVGNSDGDIIYFENTGSETNPNFEYQDKNPFGIINVGFVSAPEFIDIDGDGDIDLFIGAFNQNLVYLENVGNNKDPDFKNPLRSPFGLEPLDDSNLSFADVDSDGDFDLFMSDGGNELHYYQNNSTGGYPKAGNNLDVSINGGNSSISKEIIKLSTLVADKSIEPDSDTISAEEIPNNSQTPSDSDTISAEEIPNNSQTPSDSDTISAEEIQEIPDNSQTPSDSDKINSRVSGVVIISGYLEVGQSLVVIDNLRDKDGIGTLNYQWFAENIPISGATESFYKLTSTELGKSIFAFVSYIDGKGNLETVVSSPTSKVRAISESENVTDNKDSGSSEANNNFQDFSKEKIAALKPKFIQTLTHDQLLSFQPTAFKGFSSYQISAFKPKAFSSFTPQILKNLKPSAMPGLLAKQVTKIDDKSFAVLKPKQLGKLTAEAFGGVNAGQLNLLSKKQMKKIDDEKIAELKPKMIKGIDTGTFAMLKPDAITGFTKKQFRKVSADQLNALQEDQIQAIAEEAIPGLKKKILKKLDEAAFTSFSPDQLDDFKFKQLKAVDAEYIEALNNDQQSGIAEMLESLL